MTSTAPRTHTTGKIYAIQLKDMPTISMALVRAGECGAGHPLPEQLSRTNGQLRCLGCWEFVRGPQLCRARLHPVVAGQPRCRACAASKHEGPKDMSYLFVGLPPIDVIEHASCGPETASLFDLMEHGGRLVGGTTTGKLTADVHRAMEICAWCPVQAECRADALQWRREGVYGGAYFTKRWHQAYRSALRNGTKLPALRTREYGRPGDPAPDTLDTPGMTA